MRYKAMPYFGVAWISFFQKHVRDGPNKLQLRAVAGIWRGGSTKYTLLDPSSIQYLNSYNYEGSAIIKLS